MIAILASIALFSGFQAGDTWTSERTFKYLQDADHIDAKVVEKLVYTVVEAGAERTIIGCEETTTSPTRSKPTKKKTAFSPSGVVLTREEQLDPTIGRLNRMEWTATEARQGISWSRNWPAGGNLIEAKVLVKPVARTKDSTTMLVTYSEGKEIKCTANIVVLNDVRVVDSVSVTFAKAQVPDSSKLGTCEISEKLKELHLAGG